MAVRVERLTRRDVEGAMAGEAEGGLFIGEREEMELAIEVDLVAVAMRWLSLEDGRRLLEEDRLSMLLVGGALMAVRVERLTRRDVEGAMAGEAKGGLLEEDRLSMLLVRDVLMAVTVERLTRRDVEDAMAGEAEDGLLIGEREEMELAIENYLVAVAVRWLSLEDGR